MIATDRVPGLTGLDLAEGVFEFSKRQRKHERLLADGFDVHDEDAGWVEHLPGVTVEIDAGSSVRHDAQVGMSTQLRMDSDAVAARLSYDGGMPDHRAGPAAALGPSSLDGAHGDTPSRSSKGTTSGSLRNAFV